MFCDGFPSSLGVGVGRHSHSNFLVSTALLIRVLWSVLSGTWNLPECLHMDSFETVKDQKNHTIVGDVDHCLL